MHPIEAFIRNPIKVAVGVLLVALFGVISLLRMPMQLTPEVQIPTITVQTRWPGASPKEIEQEIVREQEEFLQSVEGLTKMTSESQDSVGTITLEFNVGTNMDQALLKVNSRLQQVSDYPIDAKQPVISASSASDRPIAWFILSARIPTVEQLREFLAEHPELAADLEPVLAAKNPGLAALRLRRAAAQNELLGDLLPEEIDVTKLRKFAEDFIEAAFERVEGVSNSNVFGGQDPEVQVTVDPHKLAARGLTIVDVRRVLRDQNKDTSGGDLWESKRRWVVRTLGQFRSPEQVAEQILAIHDGTPVRIGDVATVRESFKKPDGFVRRFGMSNIAVNVQRETGANVLDVMKGLQVVNQRLNDELLKEKGLTLTQVYDETEYIHSAVGLVTQNILVGGLLTVAVLLLFLRSARSTLVIGLAIPTSIVGTFLMLHLMGRSLNVISLAGLAFAVGMLVDNAVVVLENIFRHYQRGDSTFRAALRGTKEVWGAVVASTVTTLAVFLPVLFVQEEAGQLFRDIALAISSAVGLSLIVSVTLIPTSAARLLREHGHEVQDHERMLRRLGGPRWLDPLDRIGGLFVGHVVGINAAIQRSTLRRVSVVVLLVAVSVVGSYLLWPKVEYLPAGNRNLVFAIVLPPPGYNLDNLKQLGETVEQELRPYWDVDPDSPEARQLPFPPIGDFFYVARGRQVFVGLRSADPLRAGELVPLAFSMRQKLPGAIVVAAQSSLFEQGLTANRAIDIEITGPDLERLVGIGGRILGQLMHPESSPVPGAQARPIPSLDLSGPEVHVIPKLVQATDLGISTTDLGYTVSALIDGAYATDYYIGADKIDLVILGRDQYAGHTQDLQGLPIATPEGVVPIAAVADVVLASGPEQINHRERQRTITIQVSPPPEIPLETALDRIRTEILEPMRQEGLLSGDLVVNLSGTADKLQQTWRALRWNVVLALLITYLLMAALFESWVYPLVIILSVPLGAVGGVLGLQALNLYLWAQPYLMLQAKAPPPQTLDVLTMLGFVILIGTVVNNAILIVHQSLNHIRDEGYSSKDAILESVRTRIRPIFMTTATTVFGLLPLVLFPGAGSELYRGLGSVVLGGLLVSTIFTLVLVPTLFSLFMDLFGRSGVAPDPFVDDDSRSPGCQPVDQDIVVAEPS
jgi:hydrophobic/amphiphilic exporter-1 (mainly G- bacteria), HAE1 family